MMFWFAASAALAYPFVAISAMKTRVKGKADIKGILPLIKSTIAIVVITYPLAIHNFSPDAMYILPQYHGLHLTYDVTSDPYRLIPILVTYNILTDNLSSADYFNVPSFLIDVGFWFIIMAVISRTFNGVENLLKKHETRF